MLRDFIKKQGYKVSRKEIEAKIEEINAPSEEPVDLAWPEYGPIDFEDEEATEMTADAVWPIVKAITKAFAGYDHHRKEVVRILKIWEDNSEEALWFAAREAEGRVIS